MKVFAFCSICIATTSAFSPRFGVTRTVVPLFARPDTSALVEEALKTTASFGIDSDEAKVAWDILEEIDASDNSVATIPSLDSECDVETVSEECVDYGLFLDELSKLRESVSDKKDDQKKSLIQTLKLIKLTPPSSDTETVTSSKGLTDALEAAKAATAEFGITSPEARLAWETYEEVAAAGVKEDYVVNLSDECDLDAAGSESCEAIEALQQVMPVLLALMPK